jgi:hypothetical protein
MFALVKVSRLDFGFVVDFVRKDRQSSLCKLNVFMYTVARVTRLGEFSSIGRLLSLSKFLENCRSSQNFWQKVM